MGKSSYMEMLGPQSCKILLLLHAKRQQIMAFTCLEHDIHAGQVMLNEVLIKLAKSIHAAFKTNAVYQKARTC